MTDTFERHNIDTRGVASGEVDTICPECSHRRKKSKDKCLSVNVTEGTWLCHHCGHSGGLGQGYESTAKWGAVPSGVKRKFVRPEYVAPDVLPVSVTAWFASRGISEDTLVREGIGFSGGWIKFPYYRNGEVINIKSRKLGEKEFFQEKEAEKILYGMVPVEGSSEKDVDRTLVWVEGEMDRLAMLEAGFKYVVSVPDGAPAVGAKPTACKFEYLENCEGYIRQFETHIIATDSDLPGKNLMAELARRIGIEKCKRVEWPEGCKDANEVLIKKGTDTISNYITSARFFPVEGVFEVKDILPDAFKLYEEGITRGASTGWQTVDKFLTIRPGQLGILTGIPSSGKSSWLDALVMNLAQNEGWKTGIFSPENAPLAQHFKKLAELFIGKAYLPNPKFTRMTPYDVANAARFMQEHFYFISPREDAFTVDAILEKAKVLVFRHGINFLIIDPYNDIDQSGLPGESETQKASILLSRLQRFARMHNVFVMLVAHPTKLRKDERTGEYPVPTPYDIAGSAHFRNRADVCLAGHRPDLTKDIFELHIQKVRFKEIGSPGMVTMEYQQENGRFLDAALSAYSRQKHRDSLRSFAAGRTNKELEAARQFNEKMRREEADSGYGD